MGIYILPKNQELAATGADGRPNRTVVSSAAHRLHLEALRPAVLEIRKTNRADSTSLICTATV